MANWPVRLSSDDHERRQVNGKRRRENARSKSRLARSGVTTTNQKSDKLIKNLKGKTW